MERKDPSTPTEVRETLEYIEEGFGENLNVFRVMANHLEVARRYFDPATGGQHHHTAQRLLSEDRGRRVRRGLGHCFPQALQN